MSGRIVEIAERHAHGRVTGSDVGVLFAHIELMTEQLAAMAERAERAEKDGYDARTALVTVTETALDWKRRAERAEAVLHDLDTHPTPASKDGRCWFCAGGLGHGPDGHRDGCVWVRARLLAMAEHPS